MISQIKFFTQKNILKNSYMKFLLKPTDINKLDVDVLISFIPENDYADFSKFNFDISKYLHETANRECFEGKDGQIMTVSTKGIISPYKLIFAGLGKNENYDYFNIYKSVAFVTKKTEEFKAVKIGIVPSDFWLDKFPVDLVYKIIVESIILSNYSFLKYKSGEDKNRERRISEVLLYSKPGRIESAEKGILNGQKVGEAVCFSRDLINEPAEVTDPSYLAQIAQTISKLSKNKIKVKIFEEEEISKMGMGAFLGVAKGSEKKPKFIRLHYKSQNAKKKIVLVGKGVTFDTGGLSLKPPEYMETMKLDMAGASAVLAVFKALTSLSLDVEVVGLIAACENMPSGKALKPGDILTAMNGKTIEVLNTDAEGRLTLADSLSFSLEKEKPNEVIDLATLTGACRVALGEDIAGLWSNDKKLLLSLEEAAKISGEKVWSMPLEKEYRDLLKSPIADLRNIQTGKVGGAITAALFLKEFVGDIPWAHFDIAGPAFAEKDIPLCMKGGVGFGVRLLLHYLSSC